MANQPRSEGPGSRDTPALSGEEVSARPEGAGVGGGGPPVRRSSGQARGGAVPNIEGKAEVGIRGEAVGAGHSTRDSQDNTTGGREGPSLRSGWQRVLQFAN